MTANVISQNMLVVSVVGILCFTTVFSADETPQASESPPSAQREKDVPQKSYVQDLGDLVGLNATKQAWTDLPIALEGGSSVVANETKVSESDNLKGHVKNRTVTQTTVDDSSGVIPNYSKTSEKSIETEGGMVEIQVSALGENDTTVPDTNRTIDFMKYPFQLNGGEESDHSSVVPRKGVSPKIVPRKGAEPYEPFPVTSNSSEIKSPICSCCEKATGEQHSINYTSIPNCMLCCNTSDSEKSDISAITVGSSSAVNNSYSATSKSERPTAKAANSTADESDGYRASPPLKKKTKPLITSDDDIEQKQQKLSQSSSSEKNDFVIPVVLVILAVPVVVVLAMLFYRKGAEFWERRHYKRMDFLIDGMYND